jgi:hypothetical protein
MKRLSIMGLRNTICDDEEESTAVAALIWSAVLNVFPTALDQRLFAIYPLVTGLCKDRRIDGHYESTR